jgi:arsenate reductase (thioredoxin)
LSENKKTILFLCTGNSCRSQIAEGWARALGSNFFTILSAGLEAHGKNPRAIAVMDEVGIDISGQESTVVTDEMVKNADTIITVCGHADEHCPAISGDQEKIHWPLSDPAKASGTEEEITAVFRKTRDDIKQCVSEFIKNRQ